MSTELRCVSITLIKKTFTLKSVSNVCNRPSMAKLLTAYVCVGIIFTCMLYIRASYMFTSGRYPLVKTPLVFLLLIYWLSPPSPSPLVPVLTVYLTNHFPSLIFC